MSSAYNETIFMGFPNFIPWSSSWLLKNKAKGSITIVKRKEGNGQPCLAPWCHFKKGEFKLLVCTHLVRILHNIFNPIFMKVFLKWRVWGFFCMCVFVVVVIVVVFPIVVVVGFCFVFGFVFVLVGFFLLVVVFGFVFIFKNSQKYFHFNESRVSQSIEWTNLHYQILMVNKHTTLNHPQWSTMEIIQTDLCGQGFLMEILCDELKKCFSRPLLLFKPSLKAC